MKTVGTLNGLADNNVRAVLVHENGLIYAGTSIGFSVYDGENIVNISTGLQQEVKTIIPYGKDSLILVRDNGISVVNIYNYGFRERDFNSLVANKIVNAARAGNDIYCATNDGLVKIDLPGLSYKNLNLGAKDLPKELIYPGFRCISYSAYSNRIYLIHRKGILVWDIASASVLEMDHEKINQIKDTFTLSIVYCEKGKVFLKQPNGWWVAYNERNGEVENFRAPSSVCEIKNNHILYLNNKNLIHLDIETGKSDTLNIGGLLKVNDIRSTAQGEIVLGTPSGLVLIKRAKKLMQQDTVRIFGKESGNLELQRVFPFGKSLYFNRKGGISEFDTVSGETRYYPLPEGYPNEILHYFPYHYGVLLIASNKGYFGFSLLTKQYFRMKLLSQQNDSILSSLRIITGNWDSATSHLVLCPYRFPVLVKDFKNKTEYFWNGNDKKWFRTVRSLHYLGNYEYLLGANGNDGLIRYNFKTRTGRHISPLAFSSAGNNSAIVNQILPLGNYFYLATADGLVQYNPVNDRLKPVSLEGFPHHDQVYAMAVIRNELYVSTRFSLCKLIPDGDLIKLVSYENISGAGVPFLHSNMLKLYVRDLLISYQISGQVSNAMVYISHVGFGNGWQYVGGTDRVIFNYGIGSLQVLFGNNFSLSQDHSVLVKYRFSGSPDWQLLKGSSIQTGNLSYGIHQIEYFSIQAGKSSAVKKFAIQILRPWWATYSFYAACALLVSLGIWFFLRYKLRKKTENERRQIALVIETAEKERNRISRDFHDGVGTKLSSIKLIVESNRVKPGGNQQLFARMPEIVDEILVDIRNIINELSPQYLKQYGLSFALQSFIAGLQQQMHDMEIEADIPENIPRYSDSEEINIYRICQELIGNALRHSKGTRIKICIQSVHNRMRITVSDNGTGFEFPVSGGGHGLANIRSRITALKGEMSITRAYPSGTEVKIILPLRL